MPIGVPHTRGNYGPGGGIASDAASRAVLPGSAVRLAGAVKQSSVYLGTGDRCPNCLTDRSQYATNLTASGGYLFEASPASARFDFASPRTIGFQIDVNSTDTGHLYRHGAASPDRLEFSAANTLRVTVNNTVVRTYTVSGLTAARQQLIVAWVTEANPDTSGASDAMQSVLLVWNVSAGTFDQTRFTHAASSTKTQTIVFGADTHPAGTAFSGNITGIFFETRRASATEIANDWVAQRPSVSTVLTDLGDQGLPVLSSAGFGAASQFHGPMAAWCTAATRKIHRRTLSPLWNEAMRITGTLTQAQWDAANDPWIRGAPNANGYRMHLTYFRGYPAPPTASHLWVRVHVRSWAASGEAVPIGVRVYCFNRPPGVLGLEGQDGEVEALESYYVTRVVTSSDSASAGQWVTFDDLLPIARGKTGLHRDWTYLAVAVDVDPSNATLNDSNSRSTVNAVHAVPVYREHLGKIGFGGDGAGVGS